MKFVVIDTETAPIAPMPAGKVDSYLMRVYDLGYIIADEKGVIYARKSFIISDTFFNHALMNSAYYADKMPQYYQGMNNEWQVVSFLEAWQEFKKDCVLHNIKKAFAYNAKFDIAALNETIKDASNGFTRYFFPYKMQVNDIWDLAGATICNTKKFVNFCLSNDYLTAKGNPSTSAETVYRYISRDNTFIENHTALSDCECELAILLKAKSYRKKDPKTKGQGWRKAYKIAKELN
jgi:hypothetical protein